MGPRRCVGVDWSGAAGRQAAARAIWLAVVEEGRLVALETGRDRSETVDRLTELVGEEPETVIGLDFCFSAPAWFLDERGMRSAGELWRWAAAGIARDPGFVRGLGPPFWGPGIRPRPVIAGDPLRRTEHAVRRQGVQPSSFFKLSGPGSVGSQVLYGMPELMRLCDVGVAVWPFDEPRLPVAVEVFPRLLARLLAPDTERRTGAGLRQAVVVHEAEALGRHAGLTEHDQDAFDAAITALGLWRARDLVGQLTRGRAAADPREGAILEPELG
jgi:hypothetical protein